MTIQHVPPDNQALEQSMGSLSSTRQVKQASDRKGSSQHVAPQGKDASDLSGLSRLMAKAALDLKQDLTVRPEKVALARAQIEKGGGFSDQEIDAIWDRMLPRV